MPRSIPKFHSLVGNDLGLVLDKFNCPIKSTNHDMHADSSLPLDDTNMDGVSPGVIGTPSSKPFHPLYPNLFHESTAPVVSINNSDLYPPSVDCNHVHEGDVSQSK